MLWFLGQSILNSALPASSCHTLKLRRWCWGLWGNVLHSLDCRTCLQHPWCIAYLIFINFQLSDLKCQTHLYFREGFELIGLSSGPASSACLMPPSVSVIPENLFLTHQSASKWLYFGDFYLVILGSKITADGDCSHKIKTLAPCKKSYDKPIQHTKKRRHHFADKSLYSQSYGFSSSHLWIWELDHEESWVPKNWCFWTVVLKILDSPLDSKEIKPVNPKGNQPWKINPEYSLEGLTLKLQYFGCLMQRADSLEKTLMLGKIESKRRRGW